MCTHHLIPGRSRSNVWAVALPAVLAAALTVPVARAGAEELTLQYDFQRPEVSPVLIAGQIYDRVEMIGCANGGVPGQPSLPACGAQILLPFGAEVESIEVTAERKISLGDGFFIEPAPRPVPVLQQRSAPVPPTPDPAIYQLHTPVPETAFEEIGTSAFRGYRILTLKLQPVSYVPASGELSYCPKLIVTVNTTGSDASSLMFRGLAGDEQAVAGRVDNPDGLAGYPAARGDGKGYDLIIITTPGLVSAFQPLADYHNAHGTQTEIHTTDDVGSNDPVDVRDYIRERYLNDGIEYVIVGGDDDVIPAKNLYVDGTNDMPGDIFFSCLDGSWNWDNDGYWGEPTDGEGGGDVDLIAEVYVGRASVDNTTEATRFVNKTLWYLNGGHSTPQNALLVGEYLGFGGIAEWGGNYLDELIDGSDEHGYVTVGIPSDFYNIDTLYERDGAWGKWDLIGKLDAGVHMLNHLGHGAPDYAMHLYNSDILNDVHNEDLCFVYSQTCSAGHFDGTECWAECMNIKIDEGAYAVIMNARYGYGAWNSTDGPSQRFNREFWDAVFNPSEGFPQLGKANSDSKEDNIYRINESCMRWCCYELNLFGDPSVGFREMTGMGVSPAGGLDSEGPHGGPFTPDEISYTVINHDETPLEFQVSKTADWVDLSTTGGTIPGEGEVQVTVSINDLPNNFPNGHYEDVVEFVNLTNHEGDTTRLVTLEVGVPAPVIVFDLNTDPGWATEGQWAFGQPAGQGGSSWGYPDPTGGYTGDNVFGYNLNGDYTTSVGPPYYLTTNAIDCSNLTQVELHFYRWLNSDYQPYVYQTIDVSNDGVNWTGIWDNGSNEIAENSWSPHEYDLSDLADNQPTVYIRWGHQVASNGAWAYSGWNIDDIAIWGVEPTPECPCDVNGDGFVDIDDIFDVLACWGNTSGPCDVNEDGIVDIDDVFAILADWGPC
ncbi:MAG: hypothetical protein JSV91_02130 [Phycisphaerales bacterium]|nr:MAG: hypothetical protein JSV91_02130 [Phycisphaerales bacterium]